MYIYIINIIVFILVDDFLLYLPRISRSLSRKSLIYMLQSFRGEEAFFFKFYIYIYNVFVREELFYNESFQSSYFQDIIVCITTLIYSIKKAF